MKFLSVCSGIEAASVAWQPLGWKAVAFSEIEPFPCALLKHHYPDTPNWGDMTKFKDWPDVSIDLLCGGTPCQSFSVAGLRKGLDDPRGNLMLTFGAIAAKYRPKWLVWENVPGVLSSNNGRDFGAFLGMLGQLGYGFAYRVLDAQYFGVAQRRRRVFVVGCLGDWHSAAAVLFERHSLQGHPAPSRQARQGIAGGIEIGPAGGGFTDLNPTLDTRAKDGPVRNQLAGAVMDVMPTMDQRAGRSGANSFATSGGLVPVPHADISPALKARDGKGPSSDGDGDGAILVPMLAHALRGEGFDASEDGTGRGTPLVPVGVTIHGTDPTVRKVASYDDVAQCLRARTPGNIDNSSTTVVQQPIAFPERMSATQCATTENLAPSMGALNPTAVAVSLRGREGGATAELGDEVGNCLRASGGGGDKAHVLASMSVRRLTPGECESLQGFPQGYTNVPHRGKLAADGNRYKALGNSWAVPNVTWIGRRIDLVNSIRLQGQKPASRIEEVGMPPSQANDGRERALLGS